MRRMKKILVGLIAMVMLVGASISAFAADGEERVASITAISSIKDANNKSNITIYTNEYDANGAVKTTDMTVTCATDKTGAMLDSLRVLSSNRGVVKVSVKQPETATQGKGNKGTCTATLTLTPVANGKATVTVASVKNPKKTKKITVTVKTWANEIEFNGPVYDEKNNEGEITTPNVITLAAKKGSKLNLGAYVSNAGASNTKLKYTVPADSKANISCDAKGNVSVKAKDANITKGQKLGTVQITSADKNAPMNTKPVTVTVKAAETDTALVTSIKIAPDRLAKKGDKKSSSTKIADLGYGRVSSNGKQLYLKGNRGNANNTYQLNCVVNAEASMSDLAFTSNKPAIAAVDAKGKITALGNGKATITVTPKGGNNVKATLTVTVDTDVEYVNVANTKFTIQANNKDTAKINATTNTNAKTKNVVYWIKEIRKKDADDGTKGEVIAFNSRAAASGKDAWSVKKFKPAQYVSVDGKGNVKAKQECVAVITVAPKEKTATATATVTVTAQDAVSALTLKATTKDGAAVANTMSAGVDVVGKPNNKGHYAKLTAYRTESGNADKLQLTAEATWVSKATNKAAPSVTWTSNKPAVATVDKNGKVTLVGNGTAKITATAKSGKAAATTITVKTDVYKITPAVKVEADTNYIYVENFTGQKKVASIINATVNADASNKTLTYAPVNLKAQDITAEGTEVTVSAKVLDKRNNNTAFSKKYKIMIKDGVESPYSILADGETIERLELKIGESKTLKAMKGSNVVTDAKWASTNTKSVTIDKNGVVKAKAEAASGSVAKIKVNESETIEVVVGKKDATVQTEINKSFKTKLNEENRDYTGVSAKFNEKTRAVQMSILNPTQDINDLEDTGLVAAMVDVAQNSFANRLVFDEVVITNGGKQYSVTRTSDSEFSTSVELTDEEGKKMPVDSLGAAVTTVLGKYGSRIQDLNGESYSIALKLHYQGAPTLTYDLVYTADVSMAASKYDTLVDSKIQRAVDVFNDKLAAAGDNGITVEAGNESETLTKDMVKVVYNAAANEFDVTIEDLDVAYDKFNEYSEKYASATFEELWNEAEQKWDDGVTADGVDISSEEKEEAKTYAKDIAGDLSSVTLAFTSSNGQNKVDTVNKADESKDNNETKKEFLKRVLGKYFDQLKDYEELDGVAGNLGNLVGSVASANATFVVGSQTYVQTYKVNFLVSDNAYDKAADKRIQTKVDENREYLVGKGFEVAYTGGSNALTVNVTKQLAPENITWETMLDSPLSESWNMADTWYTDFNQKIDRLNEILDTMVGSEEEHVTKANVVVNGKTTVLIDGNREYGEGGITKDETKDLLTVLVEADNKKTSTNEATTLRDMHGRTATLKVTYDIGSKIGGVSREVTLLYTIKFTVEDAELKSEKTKALSVEKDELADEEDTDDEVIEEETDETTEDETDGTTEDETDGTTEDETDGTTEDETDGTTEDETDGATEDETDGTTEDETDGAAESETDGSTESSTEEAADSEAAAETPVDTNAEATEVTGTVEE